MPDFLPDELRKSLSDRYLIERELGAGGMATVYLARDVKHEREVALKLLREDLSASIGAGRFLREIKIAAQLQHPNILPLLDSGEADGRLYFVMPYVKGQSLRERLAREGELPVHETVRLLIEIVDALADAHSHGVVHRDIKPDNIMLSGRHALVMDFGVAKAISEATGRNTITTLGVAVGTPTYMSPEQAVADPHVDHRSDIYAIGVIAYEMLTGRPPFTGGTPQQVLAAHVTATPEPVSKRRSAIPIALDQLVMRCLEKRPADRFQSAAELLAALEPIATPSTGMTPAELPPVKRPIERPKWLWPAVGIAAVAALLIAMLARRGSPRAAPTFERVQLTTSGRASHPRISPDGKEVVYGEESCAADTLPCTLHLVIQDIASGARQPVSTDSMVRIGPIGWSASGSWILVSGAPASGKQMPQMFVMSHLGGALVPMGDMASFTALGDTLLDVRNSQLHGAKTIAVLAYVAPWTHPVDSMVLAVPDRSIFIGPFAPSPDGRWLAATWSLAGQQSGLLTIHDRTGRIVASRKTANFDPVGIWSGSTLLRPVVAAGQGGFERVPVNARTGAFGQADTIFLGASTKPASFSASSAGTMLVYDETHGGETTLSTLESASATQPYRIGKRLRSDAALWGALISPDGSTIVYIDHATAGKSPQMQAFAIPFGGGNPRPLGPAVPDMVDATMSADGRRYTVAALVTGGRTRITSYDLATGRELVSVERPDHAVSIFTSAIGPGLQVDHAVVFLDTMLVERRRVTIPDSLGGFYGSMNSWVRPATAIAIQPLDFASTFQSDWNFHVPVYIADTSGRLTRGPDVVSWNLNGTWWLADGSFRILGTLGTDQTPSFYRFSESSGPPQRIGVAPFHGAMSVTLSADGKRGEVVTQPTVSDIWLIKNLKSILQQ